MQSKPYLVLARKYRPQNFEEMIGQEPIVTTLQNALVLNRVGHAYLFTGPRGVGKTSLARIFAKTLNCQKGSTAIPCGQCQTCLQIESGRSLDVLEIDGASNRGIDEIRALRENVKFAPATGRFKIYIIDEVHQITTDGFNALLKTLEEPPAHVKFIFATTAPYKVPATILSRCQRFDFRRIPTERIVNTLGEICKKEKIKIEEDALFVIAKAADGSLRDSQSLLDQIAASSEDKVSKADVIQSLGVLDEERLVELVGAIAKKDAKAALLLLDQALKEGKDPLIFVEKLLEHIRNLLFVEVSPDLLELIDATESYKKDLLKQCQNFSREDLFYLFSVILHTLQGMRRFESKRIPLEVALVKLSQRVPLQNIAQVLESLDLTEKKTKITPTLEENDPIEDLPLEEPLTEDVIKPKNSATLESVWQSLLSSVKSEKISVASYLAEGEPSSLTSGVARISFPERLEFHRETLETPENKKLIEKHLSFLLSTELRVEFEAVKELSGTGTAKFEAHEKAQPSAEADPLIQSAMNLFGGRIVGS